MARLDGCQSGEGVAASRFDLGQRVASVRPAEDAERHEGQDLEKDDRAVASGEEVIDAA